MVNAVHHMPLRVGAGGPAEAGIEILSGTEGDVENRPEEDTGSRPALAESAVTLHTGLPALDSFVGGFRAPEFVLLDSSTPFVFDLTSRICVEAAGKLDGNLLLVDGGNSVDPMAISGLCRLKGLDKGAVFSRMSVARAFTAYQLDSLVNERLEGMVRGGDASAVVVSCILDLFFDKDMRWPESFQLIRRSVETLGRLAAQYGLLVFATNFGFAKMSRKKALLSLMYTEPQKVVRLEASPRGIRVILPRAGRFAYFHPVPVHQTVLDQYFRIFEGVV